MAVSLHFISHCKVEFKDFLWILLHISEKISYGWKSSVVKDTLKKTKKSVTFGTSLWEASIYYGLYLNVSLKRHQKSW